MARPIKETPILFGEDARRFEARMNEKRHELPEQREQRLKDYEFFMALIKRGEELDRLEDAKQAEIHSKSEV
ncbi:MAG: hypothetical protein IJU23_13770 [Proteobacteria bacterium]|nr:hypothetical protein [Pseudomonadota bacterium]